MSGDNHFFKVANIGVDPLNLLIVEVLVDLVVGGDIESVQDKILELQGQRDLPCNLALSRGFGSNLPMMQSAIDSHSNRLVTYPGPPSCLTLTPVLFSLCSAMVDGSSIDGTEGAVTRYYVLAFSFLKHGQTVLQYDALNQCPADPLLSNRQSIYTTRPRLSGSSRCPPQDRFLSRCILDTCKRLMARFSSNI